MHIVRQIFLAIITGAVLFIAACKKAEEKPEPSPFPAILDISGEFKFSVGTTLGRFSDSRFVVMMDAKKSLNQAEFFTHPVFVNTGFGNEQPVQVLNSLNSSTSADIYRSFGAMNPGTNQFFCLTGSKWTGQYSSINTGFVTNAGSLVSFTSKALNMVIDFKNVVMLVDGAAVSGTQNEGGKNKLFVLKFTKTWSVDWYKQISLSANDEGGAMVLLCDGTLCIVGYTQSAGGDKDLLFIRMNIQGDTLMTRKIPVAGDNIPLQAVQGNDCQIYVTGYTKDASGTKQGTLWKINPDGNLLWQTLYSEGFESGLQAVAIQPAHKQLIAAGYTKSSPGAMGQTLVVSSDFEGKELWRRVYGDAALDESSAAIMTDPGFYYLISNRTDDKGVTKSVFVKDMLE